MTRYQYRGLLIPAITEGTGRSTLLPTSSFDKPAGTYDQCQCLTTTSNLRPIGYNSGNSAI